MPDIIIYVQITGDALTVPLYIKNIGIANNPTDTLKIKPKTTGLRSVISLNNFRCRILIIENNNKLDKAKIITQEKKGSAYKIRLTEKGKKLYDLLCILKELLEEK